VRFQPKLNFLRPPITLEAWAVLRRAFNRGASTGQLLVANGPRRRRRLRSAADG
jgi:hypothetical protein